MKKAPLSEIYFYFKIAIVACYFAMGIYILTTENIFSYRSEALKYAAGSVIICYGLFRALRVYQEFKNRKNDQEKPN